ncbi:MAG TPA: hypothetical protein VGB85_27410 [Nannocystis sp.]
MSPRALRLTAAALGLATVVLLALGHREVGYVRDEGIYFAASRQHAAWVAQVFTSPREALAAPARDRAFTVNREHPALLKIAAGVSARLFARPGPPGPEHAPAGLLPILPEGAAMRLPAQLLAALGVALLFLAGAGLAAPVRRDSSTRDGAPDSPATAPPGAPASPVPSDSHPTPPAPSDSLPLLAGLCAALWFIALPHVWFHAGLHAFDVPVAVATLAVVLIYRRALHSPRWGLALGPALGVAISIKHNALFIPVLLALHYGICLLLALRRPSPAQLVPLPFLAMAVLAPLTVVALWPWLWSDPPGRVLEYLEFHRFHAYYNTEYFNINYNRPPLPVSYPFVLTWATVPTGMLLLALTGLARGLARAFATSPGPKDSPRWTAPLAGQDRRDGLLWALFAAFPLLLIALPTIPIFGGTKHWLTAYPFFALGSASALIWLVRAAALPPRWRHAPAITLLLLLVPGVWSTIDGHPYGLSQYAPFIGGPRGAADLGLLRGFWGHAVPASVLDPTAPGAPIYLHDMHELARQQYAREGRWPPGATSVPPARARAALIFHERHMLTYELQVQDALETASPVEVVTLDDVPLTSLYRADQPR